MAYTAAAKEAGAVAMTGLGSWISLHTSDPGTTGANEVTGGSYARKQTTWSGGAADGSVPGSQVSIDAPAGTYTYIGIWSTASGGTFVGGLALSASVTLGAAAPVLVTPTVTVA